MTDDVPEDTKKRRLKELIDTFYSIASTRNKRFIGTHQLVLVESVGGMHEATQVESMSILVGSH
jgi:tRNA A37 methylthiotransferase MiaB